MPKKPSTPISLVTQAIARLNTIDAPTKEIAADAAVNESWLKMFRRGNIPNPGIEQFSRIKDYLDRLARS